jgi:hypothetical protein
MLDYFLEETSEVSGRWVGEPPNMNMHLNSATWLPDIVYNTTPPIPAKTSFEFEAQIWPPKSTISVESLVKII